MQKKDQAIETLNLLIVSHGKKVEEFKTCEKELAEERAALSQLKEQHSSELAKQKTTLDDATNRYQNTLTEEQGKLQLKEEELGAANSEIETLQAQLDKLVQENSRIANSEDSLEQKVRSLSKDIERLEV